jgi:hypothetical protein
MLLFNEIKTLKDPSIIRILARAQNFNLIIENKKHNVQFSELNLQASVVNLTGITRYLFDNLCHLSLKLGQLGKLFGLFITSI